MVAQPPVSATRTWPVPEYAGCPPPAAGRGRLTVLLTKNLPTFSFASA